MVLRRGIGPETLLDGGRSSLVLRQFRGRQISGAATAEECGPMTLLLAMIGYFLHRIIQMKTGVRAVPVFCL